MHAPVEVVLGRRAVIAIDDQADVGARAAHVERDRALDLLQVSEEVTTDDAAGETRQEELRRAVGGDLAQRLPAVRLHHAELCPELARLQVRIEVAEEVRQLGLDGRSEDRRRRAGVFTPDRRDLVREGDGEIRERGSECRPDALLVLGIEVAEEQVDRDRERRRRRPVQLADRADDALDLGVLEDIDHIAPVIDPLAETETVSALHPRLGLDPAEVVGMRARDAADDGNVLEAVGPDVDHRRAGTFEVGVGGDRRAEHERPDGARWNCGGVESVEDSDGRLGGSRRPLRYDDRPRLLVDRHEVGKGASGVNAYSIHGFPLSWIGARRVPPGRSTGHPWSDHQPRRDRDARSWSDQCQADAGLPDGNATSLLSRSRRCLPASCVCAKTSSAAARGSQRSSACTISRCQLRERAAASGSE